MAEITHIDSGGIGRLGTPLSAPQRFRRTWCRCSHRKLSQKSPTQRPATQASTQRYRRPDRLFQIAGVVWGHVGRRCQYVSTKSARGGMGMALRGATGRRDWIPSGQSCRKRMSGDGGGVPMLNSPEHKLHPEEPGMSHGVVPWSRKGRARFDPGGGYVSGSGVHQHSRRSSKVALAGGFPSIVGENAGGSRPVRDRPRTRSALARAAPSHSKEAASSRFGRGGAPSPSPSEILMTWPSEDARGVTSKSGEHGSVLRDAPRSRWNGSCQRW